MKKISIIFLVLVFVLTGCFHKSANKDETNKTGLSTDNTKQPNQQKEEVKKEEVMIASTGVVESFDVEARRFEFSPSTIRVKAGSTVKIKLTSVDIAHGFSIAEFGISETVEPGKITSVEFVANKKGTFSFYCSVPCGEGHSSMKGRLIVE